MRAGLRVHAIQMRATNGASPVESAERDRRKDEQERRGVRDLLWQTEERRGGGGRDSKDHESDRHGQLAIVRPIR